MSLDHDHVPPHARASCDAEHSYVLPDVLDPYDDESLAGLAMRYAPIYRFEDPRALFTMLGMTRKRLLSALVSLDPASTEGAAVQRLLHVPVDRRARMSTWNKQPGSVTVLGHRVPADMADNSTRRCCPTCLGEQPYHRAIWLVAGIPACGVHGDTLLAACPECSEPLRWSGPGVTKCGACSFDLRAARPARVTLAERECMSGLAGLLLGKDHPAGYDFADAIRASVVLGRLRLGVKKFDDGSGGRMMDAARLARVLESGWSLLNPWPAAFRTFLDELVEGAPARKAKRGLAKAYGPLTKLVAKVTDDGWIAPVLGEMVDHLAGHPDISVRSSLVDRHGSGRNESARHLTMEEAARMVGISPSAFPRLAARLGLEGTANVRWGQGRFRKADIARLAARMADADGISGSEAARMLCVSGNTVRDLRDAGLLDVIPVEERLSELTVYSRRDVDRLLERIERAAAGVPRVDAPGPEHRILGGGGTKDGFGILKLVPAVLAGELKPTAVSISGKGLKRYLFPKSFAGVEKAKALNAGATAPVTE